MLIVDLKVAHRADALCGAWRENEGNTSMHRLSWFNSYIVAWTLRYLGAILMGMNVIGKGNISLGSFISGVH